jgi:hypothetical protein
MYRLLLLIPLALFATSVAHAETYTRTIDQSKVGRYVFEQSWLSGTCYDMGSVTYPTLEECQANLARGSQVAGNTTISACTKITQTTSTYSFPGPACADTISTFGLKAQTSSGGTSGGGSTGGTSGGGSTGGHSSSGGTLQNPLNNINSLPQLLQTILHALVELGAILLVIMLVWVGFLFVSAQGNAEKLSSARSALLWTVIGGLILLGAEAISQVIQATVQAL